MRDGSYASVRELDNFLEKKMMYSIRSHLEGESKSSIVACLRCRPKKPNRPNTL